MYGNELPATALATLEPGARVIVEIARDGWTRSEINVGTVAKLTPKQAVVHYPAARGTVEVRFRREDARLIGHGRGALLDPEHPSTARDLAEGRRLRRRQEIDSLAARWSRERDNLDLLRSLRVAIGEYLDAEVAS